ncbi:hypothetical protein QYE76_055915 [Lolium multiflorum]|uniref:Uncharacterized protein n=1 Tax=Lolium multiflorum TaxID=4521 RepID=A0AAD8T0L7_LOLMU|nr:hypothetical protein QYE76_055915 [Lolium multiflorum]
MGSAASGGRNREGSTFGGICDTTAVGHVLYADNFLIVPLDECWIPTRTDSVKLSIIPIDGIDIFIGETVDSNGNAQVFATLAGLDEDEDDDSQKTSPQRVIPDPVQSDAPTRVCARQTEQPQGRSLNFQEGMAAETLMDIACKNGEHVQQKEILTTTINLEVVADPEAFEARRKELLAEARNLVKVIATVLKDKVETDKMYKLAVENGQKADEEGTLNMACRMLQLYLVGPARVWLSDLPENSIFCWFDLKIAFEAHFKGS